MIRRHAATLRLLLMLTDGLLAAVVLVGLSVVRFGEDWAVWWREIIPDPVALLVALRGRLGRGPVAQRPLPAARPLVDPDGGLGPGAGDRAHGRRHLRGPLLVQAARGQPPLPAHPVPDAVRGRPRHAGHPAPGLPAPPQRGA